MSLARCGSMPATAGRCKLRCAQFYGGFHARGGAPFSKSSVKKCRLTPIARWAEAAEGPRGGWWTGEPRVTAAWQPVTHLQPGSPVCGAQAPHTGDGMKTHYVLTQSSNLADTPTTAGCLSKIERDLSIAAPGPL